MRTAAENKSMLGRIRAQFSPAQQTEYARHTGGHELTPDEQNQLGLAVILRAEEAQRQRDAADPLQRRMAEVGQFTKAETKAISDAEAEAERATKACRAAREVAIAAELETRALMMADRRDPAAERRYQEARVKFAQAERKLHTAENDMAYANHAVARIRGEANARAARDRLKVSLADSGIGVK